MMRSRFSCKIIGCLGITGSFVSVLAAVSASADDNAKQVSLQDAWEGCLVKRAELYSRSTEPAALVLRAAFSACQSQEDALFEFFRTRPHRQVADFATSTLFPAIKEHMEDKLLEIVLTQRSK